MKDTFLSVEVCNRFLALPPAERRDPLATVMRLTVEVTRELLEDCPESVDEFLSMFATQPRSAN